MPKRHISPQSFDDILTELGDDPAIPDPHGFRKPHTPNAQPKIPLTPTPPVLINLKKLGPYVGLGVGVAALSVAIFTGLQVMNTHSDTQVATLEQEIVALKNDLQSLRNEIHEIEDSLYDSIDELEVSIHSLSKNKALSNQKAKAEPIPFHLELRNWHYLGISQAGNSQKAFFQNGKETVMLELGSIALGEWQLTSVHREHAILTHPKASPLTIKLKKSE